MEGGGKCSGDSKVSNVEKQINLAFHFPPLIFVYLFVRRRAILRPTTSLFGTRNQL